MVRLTVAAVMLTALTAPALADDKTAALEACAQYLKKVDGVATKTAMGFRVSGKGPRFTVSGNAPLHGNDSRVTCEVNNGRVTAVVWG